MTRKEALDKADDILADIIEHFTNYADDPNHEVAGYDFYEIQNIKEKIHAMYLNED